MLSSPLFPPSSPLGPLQHPDGHSPSHSAPGMAKPLPVIASSEWDSLPGTQRQLRFKAHYESVQVSWKGIAQFLDQAVGQAGAGLAQAPGDSSLAGILAGRKQALSKLNTYLFNKTAPKMLDLQYLNHTRAHLESIHQQLGNESIDPDIRLAAVLELCTGLDVCREGVAANILACARDLNARTQGHPLCNLYQIARNQLIDQTLLAAVRAVHSEPLPTEGKDLSALDYQQSRNPLHLSMEIHEVQALRNALSSELGLPVRSDRYINPDFERIAGSVARQHIPKLVTTHAVVSRLADDMLGRLRSTGLLTEQTVLLDGAPASRLVADITGDRYKDLSTFLGNELGVDASLLFDSPDDDFGKLALVSQETLTQRLLDRISKEQSQTGSPLKGLGEAHHHAVSKADMALAIEHFRCPALRKIGLNRNSFRPESAHDLAHQLTHQLALPQFNLSGNLEDDRKKKQLAQSEVTSHTPPPHTLQTQSAK